MRSILALGKRIAEAVAVMLFLAMFSIFLLQVFTRYVLNHPLGWTIEVCLILYIWLVFWTTAFLLQESEHVTFSMLAEAVSPTKRRIFMIIGSLCLMVGFGSALPTVVDYVDFMQIESAPITQIPLSYVYAIFPVFLLAVTLRSLLRLISLIRQRPAARPAKPPVPAAGPDKLSSSDQHEAMSK